MVKKEVYTNRVSIWKLLILTLLTLGIYHTYWIYRNWKFIKKYEKSDISPSWRTFGSIIPILNIWLVYGLFKSIMEMVRKKNIEINWSAGLLTFLYIFTTVIFLLVPEEYFIISILLLPIITFPLIPIQNCLNKYWNKLEVKSLKTKINTGEIVLIIVGIVLWILIVFGMLVSDYSISPPGDTLEKIKNNIVWIKYDVKGKNFDGYYFETFMSGSGVILSKNGNLLSILTNRHVITCQYGNETCYQILNQTIRVRTYDGALYTVSNFSVSPHNLDIALLEIKVPNPEKYSVVSLRTTPLIIGERVIAVGYPAFAINVLEHSVSKGRILWERDLLTDEGFSFKAIDSDAYTYFGSSGGGLFDNNGNLIGINTWISEGEQRSIAININFINELLVKGDRFISCNSTSYFDIRNNCIPYCQREQVLGVDNKCYSLCKDFYCGSEEYKIKKEKICPKGYVSLDGVFCQLPPCGSPNSYCEIGQYCFQNKCVYCPEEDLFEDGTCRYTN